MIAIQDIAYVRYQAPDLDAMERFLHDFGLHRSAQTTTALFMRGCSDARSRLQLKGPSLTKF